MKIQRRVVLILLMLVLVVGAGQTRADDPDDPDNDIETQILVELTAGTSIDTIATRYAVTVVEYYPEARTWIVEVATGIDADLVADTMQSDAEIVDAETQEVVESCRAVICQSGECHTCIIIITVTVGRRQSFLLSLC